MGVDSTWHSSLPELNNVSSHSSPVSPSWAEARGGRDGREAVGESCVAF